MMPEISLNILDVAENSTRAGASLVQITVDVQPEADKLTVIITDDGCGMSRDMVDWINSPAPAKRDGHVGLFNVIQILKIYYGEADGMHAEVAEDGTTVTLRLPFWKEVEHE